MEESYEEVVIKVIRQAWTCLDFQQLPCWTVTEDMLRM
ncbi:zinc finger protein 32 isoform X2 [Prionailurus iriomotensis]